MAPVCMQGLNGVLILNSSRLHWFDLTFVDTFIRSLARSECWF